MQISLKEILVNYDASRSLTLALKLGGFLSFYHYNTTLWLPFPNKLKTARVLRTDKNLLSLLIVLFFQRLVIYFSNCEHSLNVFP